MQTLIREIYTPRKNIKNTLVVLSEWQGSRKCFHILNIFEFSKFPLSATIRKQLKKKKKTDYILEIHSFLYSLKKKNRLLTRVRTLYFPDTSFSPNTDAYRVSQITIKHSVKQPQHSQKCVCVCTNIP